MIKRIYTEVVFTKTVMNNIWETNSLQNVKCDEKKRSTLKQYLPRQKWTMNGTLISFKMWCVIKNGSRQKLYPSGHKWTMSERPSFFKMWGVIRKGFTLKLFYQDRKTKNKRLFFFKVRSQFKNSTDTDAVFTKTEINYGRKINFLQNVWRDKKKRV